MTQQGSTGNVIAALCNVFFPGLGHLIQGRFIGAVFFFAVIGVCYFFYFLIIPAIIGGILHLVCILSAALYRPSY
jgi:TM2 domain-containing membrane protein YozV